RITAPSRDSIIESFGAAVTRPAPDVSARTAPAPFEGAGSQPMLPPAIHQVFLPLRGRPVGGELVYRPALVGIGSVHFGHTGHGVDYEEPYALLAPLDEHTTAVDWRTAARVDFIDDDLDKRPAPGARFGALPPKANTPRSYAGWKRSLTDTLYRSEHIELFRSRRLGLVSNPGESERDFRIRLSGAARENRDYLVEKLRKKYTSKFRTLEDRIRRSELAVEREKDQAGQQNLQTAISFGATVLSAFLGRKRIGRSALGRATTAARGIGRSAKEAGDVERARSRLEELRSQLDQLHTEFNREVERLDVTLDPELTDLERVTLKPRKKDIVVGLLCLARVPHRQTQTGDVIPLWRRSDPA
ncbi:MAG: ATP-binding protein, partial [bacterium]